MRVLVLISVAAILAILPSRLVGQTAFSKGEKTTGLTKQCFYEFAGSTYIRTVNSYEICPVSIEIGKPRSNAQPATPTPQSPSPLSSLLSGYLAARDANAEEQTQLVAIANILLDLANQPEESRRQTLERLVPSQLQTILWASQQVRQNVQLRKEQFDALLRLEEQVRTLTIQ
jgi:hypothetical protein